MKFDLEMVVFILIILNAINTGLIAQSGKDHMAQIIQNREYIKYFKMAIGLAGVYSACKLIKANI